jgi:ubiquinone/menaquinone biosynthesis C-methylase UbiE
MAKTERYVPAAGRTWLTGLYDPIMALTMRESAFRGRLADAVLESSPEVVLDIGCGTGSLAALILARDATTRVLGVDGDEEVLERARAKTAAAGERAEFRRGLADALPVDDASVDVVTASLLLHHLEHDGKLRALNEARRVLRPGGRLAIADWGRPHDPVMRAAFFGLQLVDGFASTREHATGALPSLIEAAGFQPVLTLGRWRTFWGSLEVLTTSRSAI